MQALISRSEQRYLEDGILQGVRLDGRDCTQFRPYNIELDIIPSANGSARVYSSDADIAVGVKCEIGMTNKNKITEGDIQLNIDYVASDYGMPYNDDFLVGLETMLKRFCLHSSILDRNQLTILKDHSYWIVYIDVTVLKGPPHITLVDIITLAIRAALSVTVLPAIKMHYSKNSNPEEQLNENKEDISQPNEQSHMTFDNTSAVNTDFEKKDLTVFSEKIIPSNSSSTILPSNLDDTSSSLFTSSSTLDNLLSTLSTASMYVDNDSLYGTLDVEILDGHEGLYFDVKNVPICVCVGEICGKFVWDMTTEEIMCANIVLILSINSQAQCMGFFKIGKGHVHTQTINSIVHSAINIGTQLIYKLDNTLQTSHEFNKQQTFNPHIPF